MGLVPARYLRVLRVSLVVLHVSVGFPKISESSVLNGCSYDSILTVHAIRGLVVF